MNPVEIVEEMCHDDEAVSCLWIWSGIDLDQRSDAWKARRFEALIASYKNAARHIAEDEIA